ncbi:MAG: helix-turn-helix transcriptional regulator [Nitrospirae bacterium]|nr:helix-turn-helix transcriptional regulator [Nitrospirota bacterium]
MAVRRQRITRENSGDSEFARRTSLKLREMRERLRVSISDLSRKSGIAVSTLYKIENNKMVPTIVTLHRVARALGCNVATLFSVDGADGEVEFAGNHNVRPFVSETGFSGRMVAGGIPDGRIFSAVMTLERDGRSGKKHLSHNGEELVVCLKGKVELTVGSRKFVLQKGDALHYKATLDHGFRNVAPSRSEIVYVLTPPPTFFDRAWEGLVPSA